MTARPILTAVEMHTAEERAIDAGTPVKDLMEKAGRAVADVAWRIGGKTSVLILCGPGNNGGDGYVIARILAERGCEVQVAALAGSATDEAAQARKNWPGKIITIDDAKPATMLIDALFGTGLKRAIDSDLAETLALLVRKARHSIAVDLPSGIETDSGAVLSPVPDFNVTVALGSLKPAHLLQPSAAACGDIVLGDIGIDVTGELHELARPRLTKPGPTDHKYTRGYVLVAEGVMAGAASLAAHAAMRSGAGYVVMAGPERGEGPQALIMKQAADPKTLGRLLEDDRIDVAIIGPGLGLEKKARVRLNAVLDAGKKIVLDADALTLLSEKGLERLADLSSTPILTPHEGEFRRLFGGVKGNKLDCARAAAEACDGVIIYKGADTVIAAPDGRAVIARPAPAWLASAGTGDVLSGIVAARYAQNDDAFEAACEAVWLHGEAARRAGPFLIADDLLGTLPVALAGCLE